MTPIEILDTEKGLSFSVRAKPGARRTAIAGEHAGALKVELKSPPEGGKANRELIKLLAATLGISSDEVEIVSGESARHKRIRVVGVKKEFLEKTFAEAVKS